MINLRHRIVCGGLIDKGWSCINFLHTHDINQQINGKKSLDFRHTDTHSLIEVSFDNEVVHLNYIHSNRINAGEGTRCILTLIDLCDSVELAIALKVYADVQDSTRVQRLVDFYKKFGFVFNVNHEDFKIVESQNILNDQDYLVGVPMIRMPRSSSQNHN